MGGAWEWGYNVQFLSALSSLVHASPCVSPDGKETVLWCDWILGPTQNQIRINETWQVEDCQRSYSTSLIAVKFTCLVWCMWMDIWNSAKHRSVTQIAWKGVRVDPVWAWDYQSPGNEDIKPHTPAWSYRGIVTTRVYELWLHIMILTFNTLVNRFCSIMAELTIQLNVDTSVSKVSICNKSMFTHTNILLEQVRI